MTVTPNIMRVAALQYQWLNHVNDLPSLPPIISTQSFSHSAHTKILSLLPNGTNQKFKANALSKLAPATYRTVRFDGKVRAMDFPHPGPYVNTVETLAGNWDKVTSTLQQKFSKITPRTHAGDPRIIKFNSNYQQPQVVRFGVRKSTQTPPFLGLDLDFIQGTVLQLDIANFFPSIYTHSLDWVLSGNRSFNTNGPGSDIDKAFRDMRTQRTDGVSIGPVTSNIAAEILLSEVDNFLINKFLSGKIHYTRAVDDFTILLKKNEDIEKFVNDFSLELSKVSLSLNNRKQKETKYSDFLIDHIATAVKRAFHPLVSNSSASPDPILFAELHRVARENPDSSILKYGWKYIRSSINSPARRNDISFISSSWELLASASHLTAEVVHETLASNSPLIYPALESYIGPLLERNLRSGFTDTSCWLIYFFFFSGISIRPTLDRLGFYTGSSSELRSTWLDSFVAILILEADETGNSDRLTEIFTDADHQTDERTEPWSVFWPIRYELYRRGFLKNTDLERGEKTIFQVLKAEKFSLVLPNH